MAQIVVNKTRVPQDPEIIHTEDGRIAHISLMVKGKGVTVPDGWVVNPRWIALNPGVVGTYTKPVGQ